VARVFPGHVTFGSEDHADDIIGQGRNVKTRVSTGADCGDLDIPCAQPDPPTPVAATSSDTSDRNSSSGSRSSGSSSSDSSSDSGHDDSDVNPDASDMSSNRHATGSEHVDIVMKTIFA